MAGPSRNRFSGAFRSTAHCFGSRDPHCIKRTLSELSSTAKEKITRLQKITESDVKRLGFYGLLNEDSLLGEGFKSLEGQVASLHLECLDHCQRGNGTVVRGVGVDSDPSRLNSQGYLPTTGTTLLGTDEPTLWNALEAKYDYLLKTLVEESFEDSMRITACEMWDDDVLEWETDIAEFEASLQNRLAWRTEFVGQNRSAIEGNEATKRPWSLGVPPLAVTAGERLLLNLLGKGVGGRKVEALAEIIRYSCDGIDKSLPALREECGEIWDIIISLCGSRPKLEGNVTDLYDVVCNSIRYLEGICERQIKHQLKTSRQLLSPDDPLDRIQVSHGY